MRTKTIRSRNENSWKGALYTLPALGMSILFFIVPLVYLVYVAFFKWNGLGPMEYVGLNNFTAIFQNQTFHKALKATFTWIFSALFLHIPFGLVLSLLLNRQLFGWKFLRIMYFIPNVISTTAIAFLWYFIYHPDMGLVNSLLRAMGLDHMARAWLGAVDTALYATQVPFVLYVGLSSIIFLTQLSTIPGELYEAAEIDGASPFQKDWHVSLPMIKPALITNIMLNVAFCLRTFEYPFLMTSGGPSNTTTNLALYIYREMMIANRYGYSMAASLFTVCLGVMLMAGISWLGKEREIQ